MKNKLVFEDDGFIPNSKFLLRIYQTAVKAKTDSPENIVERTVVLKRALKNNWKWSWGWKVYKTPHYHSNVHELLVVIAGWARLKFGGRFDNEIIDVQPGDAIVIPAGVGHQALHCSKDFHVYGFYQKDAPDYDMCRGLKREREKAIENIKKLGRPQKF